MKDKIVALASRLNLGSLPRAFINKRDNRRVRENTLYIYLARRRGRIRGGERRVRRRRPEKRSKRDEASLLSGSTGVYRKHRWLEISLLPLSLALSSRSRPNPPSATPAALFISTSQQYPRARVHARKRKASERER